MGRKSDNEEYYYTEGISATEILNGEIEPPKDRDALRLYALLRKLTADGDNAAGPGAAGSSVSAAPSTVKSSIGSAGAAAASLAGSGVRGLATGVASLANTISNGARGDLADRGPPAVSSRMVHRWEGEYRRVAEGWSLFGQVTGIGSTVQLSLRAQSPPEGGEALLTFEWRSVSDATLAPFDGIVASGPCVVDWNRLGKGEERLVYATVNGHHALRWCDDGEVLEEVLLPTSTRASGAADEASHGVRCRWRRVEQASEPHAAVSGSLRHAWAGTYARPEGQRKLLLHLRTRADGSGLLSWRLEDGGGGYFFFQPSGTIASGACQVIDVVRAQAAPPASAAAGLGTLASFFGGGGHESAKVPPTEERLVFTSSWGHHVLRWRDGSSLEEQNVKGASGAHSSRYVWTREPRPGECGGDGSGASAAQSSNSFALW